MIIKLRNSYLMLGKKRVVKKFAWFPKVISLDTELYMIWFEHYDSYQRFEEWQDPTCGASGFRWTEYSRVLIKHV